jgi:glycerophosphoryl diester phosphodiesterase
MRAVWSLLALAGMAFGQTRQVVVIAHRGEHLRHPENTLPAYQAAVDLGVDFIEVDVRTSSDGHLVVMHDGTVDSRTNGTGAIAKMTLQEIRALDAGIKFAPQFAGTKVPTFDEVLELARGRVGIYVDAKQVSASDLVAALDRHKMLGKVVVYGGIPLLKEIAALRPEVKGMPEAVNLEVLRTAIQTLRPRVIAFYARDFTDELIAMAKKTGADIYVDRLGPADTPEFWQDAIDRGATGIQTDRPAALLEYLRAKGYHR